MDVIKRFDGPCEMKLMAPRGEHQRLRDRLATLGAGFHEVERSLDRTITEAGRIMVEHEFFIDIIQMRAIAKIAFNYATMVLGADTTRRPEFNQIRRFVRFGEKGESPLVSAHSGSVLGGENAAHTKGHVCALDWNEPLRALVAVVNPFTEIIYGIRLTNGEAEDWSTVECAHLFDPISRQITKIPPAT